MAIFLETKNMRPLMTKALTDALAINPANISDVQGKAASLSENVLQSLTASVAWPRVLVAILIGFLLLVAAIYTGKANLPDISKGLMTSFQSFSGLVVGLLGGEIAASKK
jgi:hypothetical protein